MSKNALTVPFLCSVSGMLHRVQIFLVCIGVSISYLYYHKQVQPYDRLQELLEVAKKVKNISAKHEGGVPEIEQTREHSSDILEYFLPKKEIETQHLMPALERNFMDKNASVQRTATELLRKGILVLAAPLLHHTASH